MARIGIIVSYPEWYYIVKTMFAEDSEIIVRPGIGESAVGTAKELVESGVEVIITGVRTAYYIKNELNPIPVVKIELSSYDIADAILRAKKYDNNIALIMYGIGFYEDCENLDFSTLFDCNVGVFTTEIDEELVESTIHQAMEQGYKIVVGGKTVSMICQRLGIPHIFIISGKHAVTKALNHAWSILRFKDEAINGLNLISGTMENASIGIIAVTKFNDIRIANKAALKFLNKKAEQVIGNNLLNLFSENVIDRLDRNITVDLKEDNQVINKRPLIIESADISSIITIEHVSADYREQESIRNLYIKKGHKAKYNFLDIKGSSRAIKDTLKIARRYASVDSTILIEGETGTGKEFFAQSIHNSSHREKGPFVAVNCAALTESLLESELFGYVGGAFTGALKNGKAGLFEMADGGTIFLDEIAEMSLRTQAKLLRVLQEREIIRLGDDRVIPVNVRIIAATNKSLQQMVDKGMFRPDLYYRISVLKFKIPPLREREGDIKILIQEFLSYYSKLLNRKKPSISGECYDIIYKYKWPGNIRELQNFCERLVTAFDEPLILPDMVYKILDVNPITSVEQLDIEKVMNVLEKNKFNKTKTARDLGISRTTLWKVLKENDVLM